MNFGDIIVVLDDNAGDLAEGMLGVVLQNQSVPYIYTSGGVSALLTHEMEVIGRDTNLAVALFVEADTWWDID